MKEPKQAYWIEIVLWMGFIFMMSTGMMSASHTSMIIEPVLKFLFPGISAETLHIIHGVVRKCAHVTEYFILGILLFRAINTTVVRSTPVMTAFISLTIVVLFAATDEFHQSFVASRTATIVDVGFDAFGGFLAQCVSLARAYRRRVKAIPVK